MVLALLAGLLAPAAGAAAREAGAAPVGPAEAGGVASAQPAECPEIMPVDEIAPGMTGTGLTVVQGSQPETFGFEVLDVIDDGIAPGMDLILIEASLPKIDEVGIWFGMSGSPVSIDGRLVGAVAYGLSWGASPIAGVTPAAAMVDVAQRGQASATDAVETVTLSGAEAQRLAERTDVTLQQARAGLRRLDVPLAFSGLPEGRFDRVAQALEDSGLGAVAVAGAGGGARASEPTGTLQPGGNFAAALSYGDVTAFGTGTTTFVCDGVAVAFGHPFAWLGATTMGANDASAVVIHGDGPFTGFKVAKLGDLAGTLDQDRLAGVRARLGVAPPTTPLRSTILNRDTGRSRTGRTDVVTDDFLASAALFHLWTNYDAVVLDQLFFPGTATASWTISGTRADGRPWRLERGNRFADNFDLSTAAIIELFFQIAALQDNDFEDVEITSVDYDAEAGQPFRQYRILDVLVSPDGGETYQEADVVTADPGGTIHLRVRLLLRRGPERTVDLTLDVPTDFRGGGVLVVRGGGFGGDPLDCLFFPEDCLEGEAPDHTFDGLLASMADAPRNDDLVAELQADGLFDDEPGFLLSLADGAGRVTERLDEVVVGADFLEVVVGPACPADTPVAGFVDVRDTNVHRRSIDCVVHRGVAQGVSLDPPRFAPERAVTRAQMATFVAQGLRSAGYDLPEGTARFDDVAGNPHEPAINALAEAGILRGRTATRFEPRETVTRAQTATMLIAALQWAWDVDLGRAEGGCFEDVWTGSHAGNIDLACEFGLVQGDGEGFFRPNAPVRRDQMSSMIVGLLTVLLAEGF